MPNTSTENPIYSWLSETVQRLFSKSPAYFKIWNIILAILALAPQLPAALAYLQITLPSPWAPVVNRLISGAALLMLFMSKLTVKDATAIAADTNSPKLPFTASKDLGVETPPKKEA